MPVPAWQQWMKDNKLMSGLGIMFAGNIGQQLRATGAFEVYVNGELLFSKLASGTVPVVEVMRDGWGGWGWVAPETV